MFFKRANQQVDVQAQLRRICDLTSPNLPYIDDGRCEARQNRTIPVLLAPWEDDEANAFESVSALTRDIGDCGISLTLPAPFHANEVAVGFWLPKVHDTPFFFLGATRQSTPIGAGFWVLGIETIRPLSSHEAEPLIPMAMENLRQPAVETLPPSALLRS